MRETTYRRRPAVEPEQLPEFDVGPLVTRLMRVQPGVTLDQLLAEVERRTMLELRRRSKFSWKIVAAKLGMSRITLLNRRKRLGIMTQGGAE